MKSRGRKSAASLTVVPLGLDIRRPEPPACLTKAEAVTWRAIVADCPGGWITPAQEGLLVAYCQHHATANFLSKWINALDFPSCKPVELGRILAMRARETAATASLATRLRLTNQSRMHARSAGRRTDGYSTGPRPWEPDGAA
jgi:hypothetical protein